LRSQQVMIEHRLVGGNCLDIEKENFHG
jgi:hypothetical protein